MVKLLELKSDKRSYRENILRGDYNLNNIKIFLKKLFCSHHYGVSTITEYKCNDKLFIVKSVIQCKTCKKTFKNHPYSQCCYIQHIHSELCRDLIYRQYGNFNNQLSNGDK